MLIFFAIVRYLGREANMLLCLLAKLEFSFLQNGGIYCARERGLARSDCLNVLDCIFLQSSRKVYGDPLQINTQTLRKS